MNAPQLRWIVALIVTVLTASLAQAARADSLPASQPPREVVAAAERGLEGFRHRRFADPWNLKPDEVQRLQLGAAYEVVTAKLPDMVSLRQDPDAVLTPMDGGRYLFYGTVDATPKMRMFVDRRGIKWEASTFGEATPDRPGGRRDLDRQLAAAGLHITEPLKVFQLNDNFAFWYIAAGEERFMYPMETVSSAYLRELQITRDQLLPADLVLRKIGKTYNPVSSGNMAGGGASGAQPSAPLLGALLALVVAWLTRHKLRKA